MQYIRIYTMNAYNSIYTHRENDFTFVTWRDKKFLAAIGRNNVINASDKREGDGCTPSGQHRVIQGIIRPDRIPLIESKVPLSRNTHNAGWCDDPTHPSYNTYVTKPFMASHEDLWRDDHVYDVILVTDYNVDPIIPYRGSAIFIHIAAETINEHGISVLKPTAGCLALRQDDLVTILNECDEDLIWVVE